MGIKLEGKPVAQAISEQLKHRIKMLAEKNIIPALLIIRVGMRQDDISYEKGILKKCDELGIKAVVKLLSGDVPQEELIKVIKSANENSGIHGIMLFRPLPDHIDTNAVRNVIDPVKDVDCMSPLNLAKVFEGKADGIVPCTPRAVIEMLRYYNIPLEGANVVVVGRSLVVGKPLAMLLLDENATVTICHSGTKDLPSVTASADIVVAAIGKAKFLDEKYFNKNSIAIDVGINVDEKGKLHGDVDYDKVFDKVKGLTPATGGIGSITTIILLSHVVLACERLLGGEIVK